ncbi:MAG: potassium/proton antiporter [Candidatus Omnitrophica bacterium]|nr:potassium/proton antiporter [Candidatus Omnitrophota bacterium]
MNTIIPGTPFEMKYPTEFVIFGIAALLIMSVLASKVANRFAIPALVIFIGIGMLLGCQGLGGIYFDDAWEAQLFGTIALALIIFSGGIGTSWKSIRPVLGEGIALSVLGVLFTAIFVGFFTAFIFKIPFLQGLLLGAIVSSTDAPAVFTILRARKVRLKGELNSLLELESGSNDPMAVFLTFGVIFLLQNPKESWPAFLLLFVKQLVIGGLTGYLIGKMAVGALNKLNLDFKGLYPVLSIGVVLLTYGLTASLDGSGFLAVYITGLVMGNMHFNHKANLIEFHDGLAWLMQIVMFVVLGLLVFPSDLVPYSDEGFFIAMFLIFIARPASVFMTLVFSKLGIREKLLVSWVGLRGAVPIILATFPILAGITHAVILFNVVFFIVLISVLIQGVSIFTVARWLKVHETIPLT